MYEESVHESERSAGESGGDGGEAVGYDELAVSCLRYLGFRTLDEVDRLTIPQYKLLMKAEKYRQVDRDYYDHRLAYLIFLATAKKKSGRGEKPAFTSFKKFFDYDHEIAKIEGNAGDERFVGMRKLLEEQEKRKGK